MRSGKLIAKHDVYIKELIKSDLYKIEDGRVFTRVSQQGHVTNTFREAGGLSNQGYWLLRFKNSNGKSISLLRARVIYEFYKGLEEDLTINHIDGNTSNDVISNLELVTQKENNLHRFRVLKKYQVKNFYKINQEIADKIRERRASGLSYKQICEEFNVKRHVVSAVVNNKTWVSRSVPK